MEIEKGTVKGSPYVGVFAITTEKIALLPKSALKREIEFFKKVLDVEVVQTTIANSSLIGVLAVGNINGFVVSGIAEEWEIQSLKDKGLKVKKVEEIAAIGNLVEVNDSKGVCSNIFPEKLKKELSDFLKVDLVAGEIAGTDLVGSCMVSTNKGFIVHPNVSEKEFKELKKIFNLNGTATTANYGDTFVGNSVVANSKAAVVGIQTSGHEIIRIDEGLKGE